MSEFRIHTDIVAYILNKYFLGGFWGLIMIPFHTLVFNQRPMLLLVTIPVNIGLLVWFWMIRLIAVTNTGLEIGKRKITRIEGFHIIPVKPFFALIKLGRSWVVFLPDNRSDDLERILSRLSHRA